MKEVLTHIILFPILKANSTPEKKRLSQIQHQKYRRGKPGQHSRVPLLPKQLRRADFSHGSRRGAGSSLHVCSPLSPGSRGVFSCSSPHSRKAQQRLCRNLRCGALESEQVSWGPTCTGHVCPPHQNRSSLESAWSPNSKHRHAGPGLLVWEQCISAWRGVGYDSVSGVCECTRVCP